MAHELEPSRATLLAALEESREAVRRAVQGVADWDAGRYEQGWNAFQILAHIAAIEWTYPRLFTVVEAPPPTDAAASGRAATPPTREMRGGNDAYNARQIAKRAGRGVADLLAEFEANRAETIVAVEIVSADLLARPLRSAGGATGSLAAVLHQVAIRHVLAHAEDLARSPRAK